MGKVESEGWATAQCPALHWGGSAVPRSPSEPTGGAPPQMSQHRPPLGSGFTASLDPPTARAHSSYRKLLRVPWIPR